MARHDLAAEESARIAVLSLQAPPLARIALASLAGLAHPSCQTPEVLWLRSQRDGLPASALALDSALQWWRHAPPQEDRRLHRLVVELALGDVECLAVVLALAADTDAAAARAMAWLQGATAQVAGEGMTACATAEALPSVGLLARLWHPQVIGAATVLAALLDGSAVASGLLVLDGTARSLASAGMRIPAPLLVALAGGIGHWPGDTVHLSDTGLALGEVLLDQVHARAATLGECLVVRSAGSTQARAACVAMAEALGGRAALVEGEPAPGLGPWLLLHDAVPVLCADLAPGEIRRIATIPGYFRPFLVATGGDGAWLWQGQAADSWTLPMPDVATRAAVWRRHGAAAGLADTLARNYRLDEARTARLARGATQWQDTVAGDDGALAREHVAACARNSEPGLLGSLAHLLADDIDDQAIVLPDPLRGELMSLVARCEVRDGLADGLGAAARARYRTGVRALFTGASGTGKTLACGWLATRLGLALYRVDPANLTSKYIGETEKNLGELFARAEHANVILLFDEADALFGKRTDVKDANDRHANQQTNYLLQRIEAYDGIVLLTSNSRTRFDSAFSRRLDVILEFPLPAPEQRRALWLAHLGRAHVLQAAQFNRLAAGCELAGGHIRNVVLTARANHPGTAIDWNSLMAALATEYRKLGKPMPAALTSRTREE